ncbi:MAG TPA: MarR family transcriptional regulator [Pseudonocardiaceae bacterium]|nr:MarR family transcriptional regulator [Pseudonocardiaceae bacterium]
MTADSADDTALDLLLAVHNLVRSVRRRSASPGLSPTQLLVLVHLVDVGPARIGELAARVSCSQPTATTVATSLESAGLVRRVPDTSDGRAITLHITDAGRNTLMTIARDQAEQLRQRLDQLDDADRDLVRSAVPVLRRMASPASPASSTDGPVVAVGSAGRRTTTGS